ncbi:hypothetical protein LTR53_007198 [Teratosphaeriaceae sp. CCFEE 6253]|nr:hypothetical protein LTR53_007198 [Teratosphaeriaceae sp. CCFEE 6253]
MSATNTPGARQTFDHDPNGSNVMEIPIVDLAGIDDPATRLQIARELALHSRKTGFAMLRHHGIPMAALAATLETIRTLLDLPAQDWEDFPLSKGLVGYDPEPTRPELEALWLSGKPGTLLRDAEMLPRAWRPHLEQIEGFKEICHDLLLQLLACFDLAMGTARDQGLERRHRDSPDSRVLYRIHRYRREYSEDCPHASVTVPITASTSGTGTIAIAFRSIGGLEVQSTNGQWLTMPEEAGLVVAYLGDVVPFWSRGQLQATRYRLTWRHVAPETQRINMIFASTTAPNFALPETGRP